MAKPHDRDNPWNTLTETQKRRVKLRCKGWRLRDIAALEGVSRQAISQCCKRAKRVVKALADVI